MSNQDQRPPRLIDLVLAKLKEDFAGHEVTAVYRFNHPDDQYYDLYIDNMYIAEVEENGVSMWVPVRLRPTNNDSSLWRDYQAADPEFFQKVKVHAKTVVQFELDKVEEAIRDNMMYFKPE